MARTQLEKALEHFKIDSGMTNDGIAEILGISRVSLWQKVRGETTLNFKQAKELADLLGMTLEELYTITPKPE